MNREHIIRMAREAGFEVNFDVRAVIVEGVHINKELERFAALVAAQERDACAQLLESGRISCPNNPDMEPYVVKLLGDAAVVIRKRGEV